MRKPSRNQGSSVPKTRADGARSRAIRSDDGISAVNRAVHAIQNKIRTGILQPGQRLTAQRKLATELNVSRTSLREALSTLEALGFVQTEGRKGSIVTTRSENVTEQIQTWRFADLYELKEVYEFRAFTEAAAIMLAAVKMTDEDIQQLADIQNKYSHAGQSMDLVSAAHYDMEFHRLIMKGSNNRLYEDLYSNFLKIFRETQMLPFSRHERRWEPIAEHAKILEALRLRDPDAASYYMSLHMQRATQRLGIDMILADRPNTQTMN